MATASSDRPLSPADMLAIVERQQADVERQTARSVPWILFAWAVTWLVGYGALWLIDGMRPAFSLPAGAAMAIFFGLTAASIALSAVLGARTGRGVKASKESAFTGTVFGVTCTVAFVAVAVIGFQLAAQGVPTAAVNVYLPVAYTLTVGLIHLMAGAIWRVAPSAVIGALLVAVAFAAGFFAYPTPYLVIGLFGSAVFLAGWIAALRWVRGPIAERR